MSSKTQTFSIIKPDAIQAKYHGKILDFLEKSYAYFKSSSEIDLKMESMIGVFNGDKNLYLHANYSKDIIQGINICKKYNIKKIVLVGGEDATKVMKELKC